MAERNFNLIELGPWGTGKSFVYRESNPNSILVSGGKVTVAQLFVNLSTGRVGLLGNWDAVAFDEVAGLQMSDGTVVNMLKDYMESGSFARGKEEVPAEASVVLVGNTSRPHSDLVREAHLFADLPPMMIDVAFLDRLHYYLPGWEVPKLESRLFTNHFGFVSDYFAEALRQLRKQSFVRAIDSEFGLGSHLSARDEKAVRKTVSGLLKILHPHGEWTRAELREYLEFALEGRRRVKEQLKKLAAHDYAKTAFSYVERDTSHEYWVEVPEQPDNIHADSRCRGRGSRGNRIRRITEARNSCSLDRGGHHRRRVQVGRVQADRTSQPSHEPARRGHRAAGRQGRRRIHERRRRNTSHRRQRLRRGHRHRDRLQDARQEAEHRRLRRLAKQPPRQQARPNRRRACRSSGSTSTPLLGRSAEWTSAPRLQANLRDREVRVTSSLYVRLNNVTRLLNTAEALDYVRNRWL